MGLLDKILTADYAAASSKQHDLPLNLHGFAEKYHFSKAILFSAENGYYYPISAVGMTATTFPNQIFLHSHSYISDGLIQKPQQ